ncbi:MAG: selenocysteine-specific translation elongation factor [Candidatus Marinimicrobia bacterium]|nr:selenocysteine-specific translation elongation factor [Candidatus Neomarinimicrobiota bacterium]
MQKVIGLAGHIDHGKTALVKALTGVDTDRLEEEKRRGVTIDIGIAFYNDDVTFIDVPGHEKFVKNMVTGVSTVDAALLVIAADDGVMPQTREHLDILSILGVQKILVALNKSDLVDPEWLELVTEETAAFLSDRGYPGTEIIPVSATKMIGLGELKNALDKMIATIKTQDHHGVFRLPIDRVFSVKGFGTVVTGTVLSHELHKSQNVELFPQQLVFPVRGLQSHHHDVNKIKFGDRGAINLGGASVEELGRGAFLGSPGMFQTGTSWLGEISLLPHWKREVKEADRVHIHVGTGKREARIHLLEGNQCKPGEHMLAQFFFEDVISAGFNEAVVIRFLSPQETMGGANLYWAIDKRFKKADSRLSKLKNIRGKGLDELILIALDFFQEPMSRRDLARLLSVAESKIHPILDSPERFVSYHERFLKVSTFHAVFDEIKGNLDQYHKNQPLGKGLARDQLSTSSKDTKEFVLAKLLSDGVIKNQGDLWQLAGHQGNLDQNDELSRQSIIDIFERSAFSPPSLSELNEQLDASSQTILKWMIQHGDLIRIDKDHYMLQTQLDVFHAELKKWFSNNSELTIAQLREIIPSTRKYLLPMLNYAERKGLVTRDGDVRRWTGEALA